MFSWNNTKMHLHGAFFTWWGVSKNPLNGFSGHRPPFSFVKNFPIFKEVNKLF